MTGSSKSGRPRDSTSSATRRSAIGRCETDSDAAAGHRGARRSSSDLRSAGGAAMRAVQRRARSLQSSGEARQCRQCVDQAARGLRVALIARAMRSGSTAKTARSGACERRSRRRTATEAGPGPTPRESGRTAAGRPTTTRPSRSRSPVAPTDRRRLSRQSFPGHREPRALRDNDYPVRAPLAAGRGSQGLPLA